MAYMENARYDRAIVDFTRAIDLNSDDANAYFNRGRVYREKGDDDRAITDFSKAIGLKPDDTETYNNRGVSYYNKKQL